MEPSPAGLVLFDGHCGLCQDSVRLLLPRDRRGRLRFASLQSQAAFDQIRGAGLDPATLLPGRGPDEDGGAARSETRPPNPEASAATGTAAASTGTAAASTGTAAASTGTAAASTGTAAASTGTAAASAIPSSPGSVLYLENGRLYRRSTATLRILRAIGPPWALLAVFLLVPRPIRDWAYEFVASRRYRWFGRTETCMVPPADYDQRFLDAAEHPKTGPIP